MKRKHRKKYDYVCSGITDDTNVVYTYNNLIEMRHYSVSGDYPIQGFSHDRGYTRAALKIIGRILIEKGFTALSPKEVAVQVALGVLPQSHKAFSALGDKLIRGYVKEYGNTRTD